MDQKLYLNWQAQIGALSSEQVDDLLRRIKLVHKKGLAGSELPGEDWLLQGFVLKLKATGVMSDAALPLLLRSRGYASYSKTSAQLREDLLLLLPSHQQKHNAMRLALAGFVGLALIHWLQVRRIPVTPNMLLLNAAKAFEALNDQFPGYVESNLFHIVISGTLKPAPSLP